MECEHFSSKNPFFCSFYTFDPSGFLQRQGPGREGSLCRGISTRCLQGAAGNWAFPRKTSSFSGFVSPSGTKRKEIFSPWQSAWVELSKYQPRRGFFPCNPFVSLLKQKGSASIRLRALLHFVPLLQGTKIKHSHSSPPKTGAGISCSLLCLHFSLSPTFFGEKKGHFCAAQQRRHSFSLMKRILSVLKPSPAL